jgi:hypothetical protein
MGVSTGGSGDDLPAPANERGIQQYSSVFAATPCTAYKRDLFEASCSL